MPPTKSAPLTHFLCLPLVTPASTPTLTSSLTKFAASYTYPVSRGLDVSPRLTAKSTNSSRDSESGSNDEEGAQALPLAPFPRKAVRPLGTLHLTLGVMSLVSKERIDEAARFLKELDVQGMLKNSADGTISSNVTAIRTEEAKIEATQDKTNSAPLVVTLRGLQPMQAPEKTSILFAAPHDSSGRLMRFSEALRQAFLKEGLVKHEDRGLKLHATIVNTVYAKGGRRKGGGSRFQDGKFDARDVIEKWKDEDWAEVKLESVAICEMGAKVGDDGVERYRKIAETNLP